MDSERDAKGNGEPQARDTCIYCDSKLDPYIKNADGRMICANCKATVADDAAPQPASIVPQGEAPTELQAIKQWIATASPEDLNSLNEAIAEARAPQEIQRKKGFPFVLMLIVMPIIALLIGVAIIEILTAKWPNAAIAILIGCAGCYMTMVAMRGRWTPGRRIWTLVVFGIWAAACINVGIKERSVMPFKPLEAEVARYTQTLTGVATEQTMPLRPKIFPLVIHPPGDRKHAVAPPSLPIHIKDYDSYNLLPAPLKALTLDEVHTVVLLDWGWVRRSETQKPAAIFAGICEIKVIDREKHTLIAETTLESKLSRPDEATLTADWYGPQPTNEEVVAYLSQLTIEK